MSDAYVGYTHRFFRKWLPFYDLCAFVIAPIYGVAANQVRCGPGKTVIDICAGTGEMSIRCARAGSSVVAVDITPEMLGKAHRKSGGLPIRFVLMDARRLGYADATFDLAVISLALHDMPRKARVQVLREAARVARERLVVLDYEFPRGMPLRSAWIAMIDLFESAYFRRSVEEGLDAVFEEAGLGGFPRRRKGLPLFAVYTFDLRAASGAGG